MITCPHHSTSDTCRIEWQEVKDRAYGAKNESGQWTGMLGEVVRGVSCSFANHNWVKLLVIVFNSVWVALQLLWCDYWIKCDFAAKWYNAILLITIANITFTGTCFSFKYGMGEMSHKYTLTGCGFITISTYASDHWGLYMKAL